MELRRLQQHWDAFGEQDPLWAVLTAPGKRGGGWEVDEFFATGRQDVEHALGALAERGIAIERGRALDFGCGVGRLTRALAAEFASSDGVDVAASMVERARYLNQDGDRVRFHHNGAPDLRLFGDGSFDFILSLIVLQHMRPELMRGYLREFVRLLRPSGVAFFSIPEWYLAGEELPAAASRAVLTLIGTVPPVAPGEIASLKLSVRNDSPVRWSGSTQLHVGDHWLRSDGRMVIRDDARTAIFTTVEPGEECEVQLDVVAPRDPGRYQLEVDVVQESVGWFADRGSPTLRVPVVVAPTGQAVGDGGQPAVPHREAIARAALKPTMEMYVMARGDVAATIEEAGGAVLDVIPADRCGPWFPSADYVVARAASPLRHTARTGPRPAPQSADPWFDERRRHAQRVMDQRLDLVDFRLTSTRRRVGRASVVLRSALRRAMFQVLRRQTEFNGAASQLIRSHGAQLDQLDELERRIARLEAREQGPERDTGPDTEPA